MDAPRGMNERDADEALRELFRRDGLFQAPEGLDARILQRIAVLPRPGLVPQKALLPKWTWSIAIALVTGIALFPGFELPVPRFGHISAINWEPVFSSPWLMMGVAACVSLLGLDAWLNRLKQRGAN